MLVRLPSIRSHVWSDGDSQVDGAPNRGEEVDAENTSLVETVGICCRQQYIALLVGATEVCMSVGGRDICRWRNSNKRLGLYDVTLVSASSRSSNLVAHIVPEPRFPYATTLHPFLLTKRRVSVSLRNAFLSLQRARCPYLVREKLYLECCHPDCVAREEKIRKLQQLVRVVFFIVTRVR